MATASNLWEAFATQDNFLLAWQRTINCTSRIVQDELGLKVFEHNLNDNLCDLLRQVQAQDFPYEPLPDHKVYVPKPSTTLRTMSLMAVPDLVIYQALVNVIADITHPNLVTHENQHIWGNLYAGTGKRWMLKPWKKNFRGFIELIEEKFKEGNCWIASTDVVAFYDTIDHARLLSLISKYCSEDQRFLELLKKCLAKWAAHEASTTMSRGIPQGSNASDFLANLYLYDIDREMIVSGYNYLRYVDDVRILAHDKSTVQRGLITFDLALKRSGLVAQVTKTSVHEIVDISKEVTRLKFFVTDMNNGEHVLASVPSTPRSEQAESIGTFVQGTPTDIVDSFDNQNINEADQVLAIAEEGEYPRLELFDVDNNSTKSFQEQLREQFHEAYDQLDNPEKSKWADSTITFCLYRLEPHDDIKLKLLNLIARLPWRSEAISACLRRYKNDRVVTQALEKFISTHEVYSWHCANLLLSLFQIDGTKKPEEISRSWLVDSRMDWYSKTIAAKILAEVPGQNAFLVECLRREQNYSHTNDPEESSVLREQLGFSAVQRIKSFKKQLAIFGIICSDESPLLHRLVVYLLQQPECKIKWEDLAEYHEKLGDVVGIINNIGIAKAAIPPCFIAKTLDTMYKVKLNKNNLRPFYGNHYNEAMMRLKDSIPYYHRSPSDFIRNFHQFIHLTVIAFYEYVLPSETGLFESDYSQLVNRSVINNKLPKGIGAFKRLGPLRNRIDHPIERATRSYSRGVTVKEVEDIFKEFQVSLQEMFDVWLSAPDLLLHEVSQASGTVSPVSETTVPFP